jgi:hypothetical protein
MELEGGREKMKKVGLGIRIWLSNSNNVALVALIVAIISLIYTTVQVGIARSELEMARAGLEISRADLEATTRPYLSIEKIAVGNTGDGWISTNITINNLGEIPATRVQFGEISINGTKIAGTEPDIDYPTWVHTTEDGVTITGGGLVTIPPHSGLPNDMILFPQKPATIKLLTLGSVQEPAITQGTVIAIGLH